MTVGQKIDRPLLAGFSHPSVVEALGGFESEQLYVTHQPRQIPASYRIVISSAIFLALLCALKVKHSREHLEVKLLRQRLYRYAGNFAMRHAPRDL